VAFRKRARYDARPWPYGIATNLIAQHRREEARQFRLRQAAGPDPVQHDWAERSALDVTAQALRAPLTHALARLARPDRDVLLHLGGDALVQTAVVDRAGELP
jgi:RNA polymerase sigma-70 factor (ECF subfamily)